MVPLKRGFSKPYYSPTPVSSLLITEDEIASSLSNDKYLVSRVSHYLEQILGRDFRVHTKPGTGIFSLDVTDKQTGVASELVNDGFGVNQTVHVLAQSLSTDCEWVCIEEPEIHLHPTAVRSLAAAFVEMTQAEGKRFLVTTHSEQLLLAFLSLVTKGNLSASDLACYLARKRKKATELERQRVNESGQIEGGLGSFLESELEDIRAFMQVTK
jgi:predicted ATPase